MKSPGDQEQGNLWKRFCDDERGSAQSGWAVLAFVVWIATQSLLSFS